ncbi:MAG: ATP-binding cassette domain-containing protein [Methanospirillum sp.]|nr:ATP-binding cassette domain-containing protein [Methanospirillum sp.]
MEKLIEINGLTFAYAYAPPAISDISLTIHTGEKIALVGSNGAGKSTLLLTLNGMLKPKTGEILFHGAPVSYDRRSLRSLRQKIGFVFQDPDVQIIAPTVWQDVAFGPTNLDYPEEKIREVVSEALHQVGLEGFDKRPPYHLSGGEKKRVAIAGVLAMDPDVLVLDEPTSMLDPAGSEDIMDLLDELNHQGKTIIISTHDVELAYPWADRIVLMENGQVIASGTPEEAFSDRELVRRARLKTPILLELYRELASRGIRDCMKLPKTVLDIIEIIEHEHHGSIRISDNGYGMIHVGDVDLLSDTEIAGIIAGRRYDTIGVMGSRAKICARHWGITPDISYAVIDKCILQAMNGKTSFILTTGGMASRVVERVTQFNEVNNRSIEVKNMPGRIIPHKS